MNDKQNALLVLLAVVGVYIATRAISRVGTEPLEYDISPGFEPPEPITDIFSSAVSSFFSPISGLKTSQAGIANIMHWEGFERTAYPDSGGYSIGVGHFITPGDGLTPASVLTDGQVWELFAKDLANAEAILKKYVKVPLTQGQFDALADFAFNVGSGQFRSSTLLKMLNVGDYVGAANQLPRWHYDNGVHIPQLAERRAAGQTIYLT